MRSSRQFKRLATLSRWTMGALAISAAPGGWARGRSDAEVTDDEESAAAEEFATNASDIPALADLLRRSKWDPTPELSGVFKAGTIFEHTEMGDRPLAAGCFSVAAEESSYTSAELVTSLQAGVSVGGPLASGGVYSGIVKKVKFGAPIHVSIPGLDLQLSSTCEAKLNKIPKSRIDNAYVVQEVLRASISEQTCGRIDAKGRIIGLGSAEAEYAEACSQASLDPVAVGFRTVPLSSLMAPSADSLAATASAKGPARGSAPVIPQRPLDPEGYAMVVVPSGMAVVGCDTDSRACEDDEHPPHKVKITHSFQIGIHEVTQEFYESIALVNPSNHDECGETCPVEQVTWRDAVQFANDLSSQQGLEACYTLDGGRVEWPQGLACTGYRLPTEAEWEYAARAGTKSSYPGGDVASTVAWTTENSLGHPHKVGKKSANAFGIFDMGGNVWEWVWDVYQEYESGQQVDPTGPAGRGSRVLRGGSWSEAESMATVSCRGYRSTDYSSGALGFRLVRTLTPTQ